jgi:hypothetical protein
MKSGFCPDNTNPSIRSRPDRVIGIALTRYQTDKALISATTAAGAIYQEIANRERRSSPLWSLDQGVCGILSLDSGQRINHRHSNSSFERGWAPKAVRYSQYQRGRPYLVYLKTSCRPRGPGSMLRLSSAREPLRSPKKMESRSTGVEMEPGRAYRADGEHYPIALSRARSQRTASIGPA